VPVDIEREQGVILEEIKMVEDVPDDLVHEVFAQQFWSRHPLGRPILGTKETVSSFDSAQLRRYFTRTYLAPNLVVAAAGHVEHQRMRELVERAFEGLPMGDAGSNDAPPDIAPGLVVRQKDIEQSHICLGTAAYPQADDRRHALYVLNTILGGSMSSRLFQHIREDRGLAYAVFSSLTTYSDAGAITVYAGCAADKVGEVIDLTMAELAELRRTPVGAAELQRAKDHLKGSLMLSLENTSSRMSQLARHEIYFGRHFSLDELLSAIDAVTAEDIQQVASELFSGGAPVATIVGPALAERITSERLRI
jgi:predicted Zn-dependent peptidase